MADFIIVASGGLLVTIATLGLVFAGFIRVKIIDSLGAATRYASLADAELGAAQEVVTRELRADLSSWPVRVNLLGVEVTPWTPNVLGGTPAVGGGLAATASYSLPAFGFFGPSSSAAGFQGLTQRVSAHAASENN